MRVVVVGAGFANKGAEAMLKSATVNLRRRLGDVDFTLWGTRRSEESIARDSGYDVLPLRTHDSRMGKIGWLAKSLVREPSLLESPKGRRDLRSLIIRAQAAELSRSLGPFDAVIDISGFAYSDVSGSGPVLSILPLSTRARLSSSPFAFLPQAWGPFDSGDSRESVRTLLESNNVVAYARDGVSLEYVRNLAGMSLGSDEPRADIAFSFEGGSPQRGAELLSAMGYDGERPLLGVSPNMRVYSRSGSGGPENRYVRQIADLVRTATDELGVDVLLQANEIKAMNSNDDDRFLCSLIADVVNRPGRCMTTAEYLDAEDSKAILGQCEFLFASRFHSLVFALSQGIPCAALGWSHKYRELLRPFGLETSVVDIEECDQAVLMNVLETGWERRATTRVRILERLEGVIQDNTVLFDDVATRLVGASGSPRESGDNHCHS